MLKIGVIGAGHLGNYHIQNILKIKEYQLVGIYDIDTEVAQKRAEQYQTVVLNTIDELIDKVDVVDIVTPTLSHFEIAQKAIRNHKHVFIEKPITQTVEQGQILSDLTYEAGVKVQVGHIERFNPAFKAVKQHITEPMFIETHRLAQFNPRGTDVPVLHDLMIHDIDIILSVVNSNVKKINASGVSVVSDTPDIANARIEFDNGCVANLTASRISMKNMRKSRFFQKDAYISVDFLDKKSEIIEMESIEGEADPFAIVLDLGEKGQKEIKINKPKIEENNAIQDELASFAQAIINDRIPDVSIWDGLNSLRVIEEISKKINVNYKIE